ncbi:MAG: putative protease YdcP [Candidatus Dichloromethanomonas elyunquensis]|nr:MAG: putative protease YdcP [Candidatus Dichloromethanomonas elyunquensis]
MTQEIYKPRTNRMELLAPAGSVEAFKAAVENGADAVYLGGKLFNARASAVNFAKDELKRALAYAHERQVRVYVTVNVLVADQEFTELADYLYQLYSMGVDALIVQDIGAAHFIREVLPEIKLHASTQMTQNNSYGLKQLEKMGFSRVVLARETTKTEIEELVQSTKLDIEVFGHGALCICYSGQCLMSSYIGARSGNRGKCAQPCRLAYQLVDGQGRNLLSGKKIGEHLLSPKDLNLSENLAELQRIGVSSLKIEGRMKRPEYVATVIRIYRKALDAMTLENRPGLDRKDRYELEQIFNRDFTSGYFYGYQGAEMMSFSRPNNRGTRAGRILEVKPNRLVLKLENVLHIGDGLEIWTNRGREGVTAGKMFNTMGRPIDHAAAGENISIEFTGSARVGDRVFKTYDEELMEKARLSFQEGKEQRKRPLRLKLSGKIGRKLRLEVWENGQHTAVESQTEAREAVHRPLEEAYLLKQLGRLGNTPFYLEELQTDLEGNVIIPVSEINELRRLAVEKLLEPSRRLPELNINTYQERLQQWKKRSIQIHGKGDPIKSSHNTPSKVLTAAITDVKLMPSILKAGADRLILGGEHWRSRQAITLSQLREIVQSCSSKKVELIWRLPRILNEEQSHRLFKELQEISTWETRPTIMTATLAGIEMIRQLDPTWPWETDHFFHIFNQAALHWVLASGGKRAALSGELNYEQIKRFNDNPSVEMTVFGDMEMMVSEYCPIGATLGEGAGPPRENCGGVCQTKDYYLKDRMSYNFPLETDRECRMHLFNAKRLNLMTELNKIRDSGVSRIRLELHRASMAQAPRTVQLFKRLWTETGEQKIIRPENIEAAQKELEALYPEGFTKGHFYRGVLT